MHKSLEYAHIEYWCSVRDDVVWFPPFRESNVLL